MVFSRAREHGQLQALVCPSVPSVSHSHPKAPSLSVGSSGSSQSRPDPARPAKGAASALEARRNGAVLGRILAAAGVVMRRDPAGVVYLEAPLP